MQVAQKKSSSQSVAATQSSKKSSSSQKASAAPQAEVSSKSAASSNVSIAGMDPNNILAGVHPGFAAKVRSMLSLCAQRGLNVKVQEGMRSIARQNALYAQGRTTKGPKVTWVKGGGSYHNYGLAVDIVFKGSQPWGEHHPWSKLGKAGTDAGLYWGGNFGDRPHFEVKGISIATLQQWNRQGGMSYVWSQASKIIGGGGGSSGGSTQTNTNSGSGSSGSGPGGTYTVKSGDTLSAIAQRLLGSTNRWREIANLNGIKDAGSLRVGQVLKIPGGSGSTNTNSGSGSSSSGPGGTYTVKSGDTLSKISERLLGRSDRWREIANLNGIKDATSLRVGQVLKLPGSTNSTGSGGTKTTKTYTVKRGDTLSAIAQKQLGNATRWREIANLNGIKDVTELRIGQVLKLP